ncbi:MAG TPA: PAS domain-containing sensor histidine kinase [Acidimicrobiales bacterium]|nr:PAS domain-containing sensor histidine kinase [Acidimicrobiales bacterium]
MRSSGNLSDEASRAAVRRALGAISAVTPVGIVATDADGLSWYHNQRWEDFSGTPGQSLRDRPWYLAVHPDDVAGVADRWGPAGRRQGRFGGFRAVGADGTVRRCDAEVVPMVGRDGAVDGYLIVITDVDAGGPAGGPALSGVQLLDVVLDRSHDVITILNPDGSWRWSSGAALRLIGHQADFDPQAGIFGLIHPDDVDAARRAFERAVAGEVAPGERFELRLRAADGSWRYMEALIDALVDDPAVRGVVVHARDVTERRQVLADLEASNRWLSGLIDGMQTGVVLEDDHRVVVLANQAFVDLFHLPLRPQELQGRTLASVGLSADKVIVDPPDAAAVIKQIRARPERLTGVRFTLVDGRTLECDFVPMYVNGTYRGHLSAYRDVTRQALAEAEQQRLLASERAENRRLAEMDAYRSESLAAVSHELRTPLTSIVGYTQLLRNMLEGSAGAAEEVEYLDAIVRNVDRLLRLAGDLVGLDSLESRALPLTVSPVDVPATLRRAQRTMAPETAAKGITVQMDLADGPALSGDEDRLAQLFENLLSNAVKFTAAGGRITVRAVPIPGPIPGGWEVEIADTGIGIPDDEQDLLFTRFFRASNARTRGLPGTGLGLSVAKAIVDRHDGTISVRSVVGVGTSVVVSLRSVDDGDR